MLEWMNIATLPAILLAALRLAGMFLAAPVLGHWAIPVRIRLMLSVVIAMAVAPGMARMSLPAGTADLLLAGAMEMMLGAAIGYAAGLVFAGLEMAGGYISQQIGIGLIEALNPLSDEQASDSVRRLVQMLWIVIFLAIGGHRQLLSALLGSFEAAPLIVAMPAGVLELVTNLLMTSFVLALKVAAPVVITLLLVNVAIGVVQRTMPQLNTLSIGLPITALLGLLALAGAVGMMMHLVQSAWTQCFLHIDSVFTESMWRKH